MLRPIVLLCLLLQSIHSFNVNWKDCVCLVTGASRGIGKGIAIELGAKGATVYVTGTSIEDGKANNQLGTIQQTAREIDEAGGKGIPCYCDHLDDAQVQEVMDQIEREHGKLDLLVNNCFRLPPGDVDVLYSKFWEQDPSVWDTLHGVGLRSHFVATQKAMPLLFKARASTPLPRPFVAMISSFGGLTYTFNVAYNVGKAALDRMVKDFAVDLEGQNVTVVSFWPGVVKTERTQAMVDSGEWDKKVKIPLENAETPRFTGRAIVNLAQDPRSLDRSGSFQVVAELAEEFGFSDIDGSQPPSIRSLRFLLPSYAMDKSTREKIPSWLIPNWKLPFSFMAQGGRPPAPNE